MIIIPMAGLSRRFAEAGYTLPKYMLPLDGGTVFDSALKSFSKYFTDQTFVLAVRDVMGTRDFVTERCRALGIADFHVVTLDAPTDGQAETVSLAIDGADIGDDAALTIFNIDTFRPGFSFPTDSWMDGAAGYLEVFRGSGDNWSYVRPAEGAGNLALEVAEKRPISDLCCTGLYHFARAGDFRVALQRERMAPSSKELFVAPLYNHIIADGGKIHFHEIARSEVVFCGVPSEYEALIS
ncbi:glycosyltransferase family 2 protein [Novosphingobium sp. FSW06-99]|uniref:glycosyltransferase family 2 protein n=1 Tax=Novosphingobium sp. FSW06-99 TaxID=1739113 RepID=UPI00076C6A97|nr:glycosyltransferase family 2 protein [Novosphingobium sp. FSW06-99]KUR80719.1 capsular biosynthesis protein [Novosphingobium sp. FSW06-99]